jgi:hypothetical protein
MSTGESDKARKMLEQYIESKMPKQLRRDLEDGIRNSDRPLLERALDVCAEEGFRTKLTRQVRGIVVFLSVFCCVSVVFLLCFVVVCFVCATNL